MSVMLDGRPVTSSAQQCASAFAHAVDREARFPAETVAALRSERALSLLVPQELGGAGATVCEAAEGVFRIARHCASSAMVLAMHHLQVACLARHGRTPALRSYLSSVASEQLLLASATSEAGVGGALRTSRCALEREGGRFRLQKQASVISYGAFADGVLATCRRGPDAPPSDQVLVVCAPPGLELTQVGEWDTLGMRGTVSPGFLLAAEGPEDYVVPDPFGDIASQTMMPVSHVLWSHVWLGIAAAAMSKARTFVQHQARKNPGTTPGGAGSLAELAVAYQQMEALVRDATASLEASWSTRTEGLRSVVSFNSLKVAASTLVVEIVTRALAICGMAGYAERSPFSLGRQLRDAHGAALMVNNERILADNAQLLLVSKEAR